MSLLLYGLTLIIPLGGTLLLLPAIVRFCHAHAWLDQPGGRRQHRVPIPRLGGIAFFLSFTGTVVVGYFLAPYLTELSQLQALISIVAQNDVPVIIYGESGTGKELVARAIHYTGKRADKPFVVENCGAIPENLIENELFGHVKGAYTDARTDHKGLFEEAHDGTLFLDEIGELPLPLQVKFLRVLQDGEFKRIGSTRGIKVDVRVIAATNKDLIQAISEKSFREDLFYRLNVIPIHLPPLRERKEDIPLLINHFLTDFNKELGKIVEGFSPAAIQKMMTYQWPGNIRELKNKVNRRWS